MKTTTFLYSYWQFNIMAVIFLIFMVLYHFISNNYKFSSKSPLFFLAAILYVIATLSPVDYLGKYFLLSAQMVQHILLLLVIPPMILVSSNKKYLKRLTHTNIFHRFGNVMFYPLFAWFVGTGSMWILHIPSFIKAANDSALLMNLQMILLPILGLIFIWPVFSPVSWQRIPPLPASVYLFLACVSCTVLGILITFAPEGLFIPSMFTTDMGVSEMIQTHWGLNAKTDQMIGGLIMWVPACIIYLTYIVVILYRWFSYKAYEESRDKSIHAQKL